MVMQGLLVYGEMETYVATFIVNQLAVDGAGVRNSVLGTISSPGNSNNVTDTSDDGDDLAMEILQTMLPLLRFLQIHLLRFTKTATQTYKLKIKQMLTT